MNDPLGLDQDDEEVKEEDDDIIEQRKIAEIIFMHQEIRRRSTQSGGLDSIPINYMRSICKYV